MSARWYVLHVYSGSEKKVAESIKEQAVLKKMEDKILDVIVPTEDVVEVRKGSKVNTERKFFPGYILIKMEMTDESWHVVRNICGVTGFVGPGSKPVPLTEDELAVMQGGEAPKSQTYKVGDEIKIVSGSFEGYGGKVYDISEDGGSMTVLINTGKRDMPVRVAAGDVKLAE